MTREQRQRNIRMALTLASVALIFGLGFMAKIAFYGH